jgi:cytochrome c
MISQALAATKNLIVPCWVCSKFARFCHPSVIIKHFSSMKKLMIAFLISGAIVACNSEEKKPAEEKKEEKKEAAGGDVTVQNQKGLELIGSNDCTTCHRISEKNIGPAYTDVAQKYENTQANIDTLVAKVIKGGSGNWGAIQMTPHPALSKEDATEMIKYILALKK